MTERTEGSGKVIFLDARAAGVDLDFSMAIRYDTSANTASKSAIFNTRSSLNHFRLILYLLELINQNINQETTYPFISFEKHGLHFIRGMASIISSLASLPASFLFSWKNSVGKVVYKRLLGWFKNDDLVGSTRTTGKTTGKA